MLRVLIPARKGSQGVPGKNLRRLHGVSLVERALQVALDIGADTIDLSTDYACDELPYGCRPFHLPRPPWLCTATAGMSEVLIHWAASRRPHDRDDVVLVQPTSLHPHRADLIRAALNDPTRPVISVDEYPARWHPWYALTPDAPVAHVMPKCRQDLPTRYRTNGLYYLLSGRQATLGVLYVPQPTYLVTPGVCNIDTEADWEDLERRYGRS